MAVLYGMPRIQYWYSARSASCLCASCLLPAFDAVSVTGCLRLTVVCVICHAVNPRTTAQKIWRTFLVRSVMTLN